jgi:hypothetical protein
MFRLTEKNFLIINLKNLVSFTALLNPEKK